MRSLFCSVLLLLTSFVFAQKSFDAEHENFFRFGIKAGANINRTSGQSFKKDFSFNYQAGGFIQLNFSKHFGVQPEINFVQSRSEFTNESSDVYDDLFRNGSQKKAKLNQLEIPVLLNINLGSSKRVKVQTGPAFGKLIKEITDSLTISSNIYKQNEWSLMGGLMLQLPLLHIGARYKHGLTNINNIDNQDSWKNRSIQFFAGLTF